MIFQVSLDGSLIKGHIFHQIDDMGMERVVQPQAVLYSAKQRRYIGRPLTVLQLFPKKFFRPGLYLNHIEDFIRNDYDFFKKAKAKHFR